MERENGYYWVRNGKAWQPAKFDGELWQIIGFEGNILEIAFDEIKPIEIPPSVPVSMPVDTEKDIWDKFFLDLWSLQGMEENTHEWNQKILMDKYRLTNLSTPSEEAEDYPGSELQPLFDLMHNEHGLTLLSSEMAEIISLVHKNYPAPIDPIKAREIAYNALIWASQNTNSLNAFMGEYIETHYPLSDNTDK